MLRIVTALDLSHEAENAPETCRRNRQALAELDYLPDRARVIVNVGRRAFITTDAVNALQRHLNRLDLQLEGSDFQALRRWHDEVLGQVIS